MVLKNMVGDDLRPLGMDFDPLEEQKACRSQ
jgi:hypothetical protein